MNNAPLRQYVPWPVAPTNGQTIILFTTHARAAAGPSPKTDVIQPPQSVPAALVNAVEIVWHRNDQASAANGVRLYVLNDDDVFREADCKDDNGNATIGSAAVQAVGVLAAGQERRLLIDLSRYRGAALEYTAGATGPTTWNGTIMVHLAVEALVR